MSIKIQDGLPAKEILTKENVFIIDESRASHQDIRPLKIAILNLMPTKIITETQLLRLLGNTPLQVDVDLLYTKTHKAQNTSEEHLLKFYKTFNEVKNQKYDGLIITGAPVELLEFEELDYWEELKDIMDWSVHNVYSTLHICWGAQAGLYHHYKIPKYKLDKKMFGIFKHTLNKNNVKLSRGFDDEFFAPHSRHTEVRAKDINKVDNIEILSESKEAGVYIVASKDGRQIFVTGHSEYDSNSLKIEFERDINKGIEINVPLNYFPYDDPKKDPVVKWRGHANLLFSNWLNYYVYQETPYDISKVD